MAAALTQPALFVKSFFADSVEETLDRAHEELGPDALLLEQKEAPPVARHLGAFEVVFGVHRGEMRGAGPRVVAPPPSHDPRQRGGEARISMDDPSPANLAASETDALIVSPLIGAGIDPAMAAGIKAAVRDRLRRRTVVQIGAPARQFTPEEMAGEMVAELESRFEVAPQVGDRCVLVGPPGAGKTTTLIKLAVRHGLALGRPVQLLSLDNRRIGAAAQMQSFASILGVPCSIVASPSDLAEAIGAASPGTLLLIDTPGHTAATMDQSGRPLAEFLSQRQDIDTHLILTATGRPADIRLQVERFAPFHPAKLLFTRLDETSSMATVFSEAARARLPISFFATGDMIPEDLEPASKDRVTRALALQLPHTL